MCEIIPYLSDCDSDLICKRSGHGFKTCSWLPSTILSFPDWHCNRSVLIEILSRHGVERLEPNPTTRHAVGAVRRIPPPSAPPTVYIGMFTIQFYTLHSGSDINVQNNSRRWVSTSGGGSLAGNVEYRTSGSVIL